MKDTRNLVLIFFSFPSERDIDDRPRFTYRVKRMKCLRQYCTLLCSLKRLPEGMTERPFQKNGSWRFDLPRVFSHNRYPDRRDPLPLNFPLYESHGLVAYASPGRQQDGINVILLQSPRDIGGSTADERKDVSTCYMSHKTIMDIRQATNDSFFLELLQPLDGKDNIDIPVGIGMVIVVVRDHQA